MAILKKYFKKILLHVAIPCCHPILPSRHYPCLKKVVLPIEADFIINNVKVTFLMLHCPGTISVCWIFQKIIKSNIFENIRLFPMNTLIFLFKLKDPLITNWIIYILYYMSHAIWVYWQCSKKFEHAIIRHLRIIWNLETHQIVLIDINNYMRHTTYDMSHIWVI